MLRIGIVGGLSPESTTLYYRTIVCEYRRRHGDEKYPTIIIYSVNFGLFHEYLGRGDEERAAEIIIEALNALHRAGADFALISANTPHMLMPLIAPRSPLPILHIADALAEELIKHGVKRVGLLGTRYTLTHGFYVEHLKRYGIEALIPEPTEVETVNRIIFDELVKGIVREESRRALIEISKRLVQRGAEAIALACTELPLAIPEDSIDGAKVFDTAKIHAIKALELAERNTLPRSLAP